MTESIVVTFTRPSSEEESLKLGTEIQFEELVAEYFGSIAQPGN